MATMHLTTPHAELTFIHITKTGGTSVTHWLDELPNITSYKKWKHHESSEMLVQDNHVSPFIFTVVRNPWDRVVSGYHYLTQRKGMYFPKSHDYFWETVEKLTGNTDLSFDDWVKYLPEFKMHPNDWASAGTPQSDYIRPGIDHVVKFESIDSDFVVVQELCNDFRPLPKTNKSQRDLHHGYYSDANRLLVAKMFEKDIDLWKYAF